MQFKAILASGAALFLAGGALAFTVAAPRPAGAAPASRTGSATTGIHAARPGSAAPRTERPRGTNKTTDWKLDEPSGLAVDSKWMFVTNEKNNTVTRIELSRPTKGTTISGSKYKFDQPDALLVDGSDIWVANHLGSLTEITSSGAFVRSVSGRDLDLNRPIALAIDGPHLFVLDAGTTRVPGGITELDVSNGHLMTVLQGANFGFDKPSAMILYKGYLYVTNTAGNTVSVINAKYGGLQHLVGGNQFDSPDGVAATDEVVWVANSANETETPINAKTAAVGTPVGGGSYLLNDPGTSLAVGNVIYIASPPGASPMITDIGAKNGNLNWTWCNTNASYYFQWPSAFAVASGDLWVANSTGNSLTEMNAESGALVNTFNSTQPAP